MSSFVPAPVFVRVPNVPLACRLGGLKTLNNYVIIIYIFSRIIQELDPNVTKFSFEEFVQECATHLDQYLSNTQDQHNHSLLI